MKTFSKPTFISCGRTSTVTAVIAFALLAGCQKKPGGQVAAVVNNHEITQQELRAEAIIDPATAQKEFSSVAPALLQRIIERTLLADYARDKGIDRGPEYVARRRQMEQTLLAGLAVRDLTGNQKPPTAAEMSAYIKDNATLFDARERLTIDQLQFPTPANRADLQTLTKLGKIDAVYARLRQQNVPVKRGTTVLDTGSIEPAIGKQIVALRPGMLFDLTAGGITYISTIVARAPNPTPAQVRQQAATAGISRQRLNDALGGKLQELKKSAKVTYDPAYKPANS